MFVNSQLSHKLQDSGVTVLNNNRTHIVKISRKGLNSTDWCAIFFFTIKCYRAHYYPVKPIGIIEILPCGLII